MNPICTYRFASAARDIDQNTPQQGGILYMGRASYDNAITTLTYVHSRSLALSLSRVSHLSY